MPAQDLKAAESNLGEFVIISRCKSMNSINLINFKKMRRIMIERDETNSKIKFEGERVYEGPKVKSIVLQGMSEKLS